MKLINSAFGAIIETHLAKRGWTLPQLARVLSPTRPEKSLRNLRNIYAGEGCGSKPQAEAIRKALEIPADEYEAALKADDEALKAGDAARLEEIVEDQRRSFHPHLWIEVTRGWHRPLLWLTGTDIYRKVAVPDEWAALQNEEEIIRRAGEMVAAHYLSKDLRVEKEHLVSYLYRREFELGYRFDPEGRFLEKVTRRVLAPIYGVVVR